LPENEAADRARPVKHDKDKDDQAGDNRLRSTADIIANRSADIVMRAGMHFH
jgi:hypothetical protein